MLAVGLVVALGAAGCGSSDDGGSSTSGTAAARDPRASTIGLMVLDLKNEFFASQADTVRGIVEQAGGDLAVMDPSGDPARQLQMAQDWLNQGKVQALVGSTVDINAFQPALDKAAEKGVPVVTLGFEPERLQRAQAVVTQDFKDWGYKMGAAMARCVDDRLGGEGEVVILDDTSRAGPIIPNLIAGEKAGLATNPGAKIIAQPNAGLTRLKGLQTMQDVLQAHPDANVVLGTSDDAVLGAMQALEAAGKDPKRLCLVGTGGVAEAERMLASGAFYAEPDLRLPYIYGTALRAAWALIANPDDPAYSGRVIATRVGIKYHDEQ